MSLPNLKNYDYRDYNKFNRFVEKWKPSKEVFAFTYGDNLVCGVSLLTPVFGSFYFRRFLKVPSSRYFSIFLPAATFSVMNTYLFQQCYVNMQIIREGSHPLMLTTLLGQVFTGAIIPLALITIGSLYIADRGLYYPVPPLLDAPREVAQLWWKIVKPKVRVYLGITLIQLCAAWIVLYEKQKTYAYMKSVNFRSKPFE